MTTLCVTVDHELPSSGGDPWTCGLGPAERIAARCRAFGAPVTWFPDALGWSADGERVAEQLRRFLDRGDEVGVHVHPEHREVGATCATATQLDRWVGECVSWVAQLGSRPVSIRAGAWSLPARGWGSLMRRHGLWVDSSVLPGRWLMGSYDFRGVPSSSSWAFSQHPTQQVIAADGGLVELPVSTAWLGRVRDLRGLLSVRGGAPGCRSGRRRRRAIPARLVALGTGVLDPCAQPWSNLERVLGAGHERFIVVVHTQRFSSLAEDGLAAMLAYARERGWRLSTLAGEGARCA